MRHSLLLSLLALAALPACRKSPPETGGALGADSAPAGRATSVTPAGPPDPGAAPPTRELPPAEADALAPALAATTSSWVVGWEEDLLGEARRLVATTEVDAGHKPPHVLSPGPAARALRLAAQGERVLAVWLERLERDEVVQVRPLGPDGAPTGAARRLSRSLEQVGPPELLAFGDGFVAAFVDGASLRAVRLDADGTTVEETTWPGANRRPHGPNFGGDRLTDPNAPPPPPGPRGAPYPLRPTLFADADGLHAVWEAECWFSDDQSGSTQYHRLVEFPDQGAEPDPLDWRELPVWAALRAFGTLDGKAFAIQSYHDPNGGPWELSLRPWGADEARAPFTSEPAGPLDPLTAVVAGDRTLVAWASTHYGGVGLAWLGADGAPRGRTTALPSAAVAGEIGVAAAATGDRTRVAYVDVAGGRTVVRVADPTTATEARPAPAPCRGQPFAPAAELRFGAEMAGVRLAAGGTALLWIDSSSTNSHALGWVLDAAGNPLGEAVDLSPGSPRTEFVTLAAAPRGGAFGAFTRCADYSICGKSVVQLATFAADGAVRAATVTADDGRYWGPALAVLPAGGADAPPRLALAMGRGEYSERRVVVRFADLPDAGDPGAALRTAEDVVLPANRGDDVGAVAAAAGPAGLVVAFVDDGPGDSTILRTFLVRPDAAPVEGVTLEESDPPAWGAHRLVGYPGGVALVGSRPPGHETDTVLLLLEPDASAVRRTIVVGRGLSARNPTVAFADGRFGLGWYDGATDGIWAALVDDSGRKALGASRLDDPAARASFGYAVVVPPAADGPWSVWYTDPYRLERAELPVPATP